MIDGQFNIELLDNQNKSVLDEWDEFVMSCRRGHYCQLATTLQSLSVYGMTYCILVARLRESGRIIGGMGLMRFGVSPLALMNSPIGPIVDEGFEEITPRLLAASMDHAKATGMAFLQLHLPLAQDVLMPSLLPAIEFPDKYILRAGAPFRVVSTNVRMMLWIKFAEGPDGDCWQEQMLQKFNSATRRNIRLSLRSRLECRAAKTEDELHEAFSIIELNGREQGYPTRRWKDYGQTILAQVAKGQTIMLTAHQGDQTLGAHYGAPVAGRYTYLMGGTLRTKPDPKVGHFLHWSAMQKGKEMGLNGYDFASGGSPGVMRFKMGFQPEVIHLIEPQHTVFRPLRFAAIIRCVPWMRHWRGPVSDVLSTVARMGNWVRRKT